MINKEKALKLALEPVMSVYITKDGIEDWWHKLPEGRYDLCDITAIRSVLNEHGEALAESALERIAENERELGLDYMDLQDKDPELIEQPAQGCEFCSHPLYAGTKCKNCGREQPAIKQDLTPEHPAPVAEPHKQQEPVGVVNAMQEGKDFTISKPWRGLTDEERDEIYNTHEPYADLKAVEAKLRERNEHREKNA